MTGLLCWIAFSCTDVPNKVNNTACAWYFTMCTLRFSVHDIYVRWKFGIIGKLQTSHGWLNCLWVWWCVQRNGSRVWMFWRAMLCSANWRGENRLRPPSQNRSIKYSVEPPCAVTVYSVFNRWWGRVVTSFSLPLLVLLTPRQGQEGEADTDILPLLLPLLFLPASYPLPYSKWAALV